MDMFEAMRLRHSVRSYLENPLEGNVKDTLQTEIDRINGESGLHLQLIDKEPRAFDSLLAHYGKFSRVTNYIALVGRKSPNLDELCGFYG